jgi:hypothetical protein
MGLTIVEELVI